MCASNYNYSSNDSPVNDILELSKLAVIANSYLSTSTTCSLSQGKCQSSSVLALFRLMYVSRHVRTHVCTQLLGTGRTGAPGACHSRAPRQVPKEVSDSPLSDGHLLHLFLAACIWLWEMQGPGFRLELYKLQLTAGFYKPGGPCLIYR